MEDRFKVRVWIENEHSYYHGEGEYYHDAQNTVIFHNGKAITVLDAIDKGVIPNAAKEQCTGLKDRNGKLIYEGDIVLLSDNNKNYQVFFDEETGQFQAKMSGYEVLNFGIYKPSSSLFTVIGNIHENPELMEEKYADSNTD